MCSVMGDPDLRSDERILIRTPGVYVKSIPFEGILTNKRIILVDRATNLIPQKEIPLVTIREAEAKENAIRDQILQLSVLTRTGETRQMILTFSRQAGGNRIRERDAWLKTVKEHTSSTFEQVIRRVVPGQQKDSRRPLRSGSPHIKVISSPGVQDIPAPKKTQKDQEPDGLLPGGKTIEIRPDSPSSPSEKMRGEKGEGTPSSLYGIYCSRCGNRVPEGSGYCNRCGSRIVDPGSLPSRESSQPAIKAAPPGKENDARTTEPFTPPSAERISGLPPRLVRQEPGAGEGLARELPASPASSEEDERPREALQDSGSAGPVMPGPLPYWHTPPPSEPPGPGIPSDDGFSARKGRMAVIGIIAVIVVISVIVGGFIIYPMISGGWGITPDAPHSLSPVPTIVKNSATVVIPVTSLSPVATTAMPVDPGNGYGNVPGNSPANVGL